MALLDLVHTIQLPSAKALAVAIHPEGRLCAAGDRDGVIHIIDVASDEVVRKLRPHNEFVYTLAFHPETGHLFSAGKDKSIREWDIESGEFIVLGFMCHQVLGQWARRSSRRRRAATA